MDLPIHHIRCHIPKHPFVFGSGGERDQVADLGFGHRLRIGPRDGLWLKAYLPPTAEATNLRTASTLWQPVTPVPLMACVGVPLKCVTRSQAYSDWTAIYTLDTSF